MLEANPPVVHAGCLQITRIVQVDVDRRHHGGWAGGLPTAHPDSRRTIGVEPDAITCAAVETILSVLQVAIAVIVIFLVLMHSGKDSGLSGAFGVGTGTGPLGGGSMVERNLNRWTIFFAIVFLLNAIVLLKQPWA